MRNITSNLYFASFITLAVGIAIWYLQTEIKKENKQIILSIFTDILLQFAFSALGINALLNIQRVIQVPYSVLIFSSDIIFLAALVVVGYNSYKYGKKLWENPKKARSVTELLLLIGLMNHVYLYFLHSAKQSVIFITFYLVLLSLVTFTKITQKIDPLIVLGLGSIVHIILMRGQPIIYFNFAFNPIPLAILGIILIGTLFYYRRTLPSKVN